MTNAYCQSQGLEGLALAASREELQRQLKTFEREMRILAGTYVTTERFLKDFLKHAEKLSRGAPADERTWVSEEISHILTKFGFGVIDDDP